MKWTEEPGYTYIDLGHGAGSGVRCMDCRHERVVGPGLSRCRAGQAPATAAGNWRSDYRHCERHEPKEAV